MRRTTAHTMFRIGCRYQCIFLLLLVYWLIPNIFGSFCGSIHLISNSGHPENTFGVTLRLFSNCFETFSSPNLRCAALSRISDWSDSGFGYFRRCVETNINALLQISSHVCKKIAALSEGIHTSRKQPNALDMYTFHVAYGHSSNSSKDLWPAGWLRGIISGNSSGLHFQSRPPWWMQRYFSLKLA